MRQFLFRWAPVILWAVAIFTISSFPALPEVGFKWWDFTLKKTAHVIEYAILFFLVLRAFRYQHWFVALIICIIYALSDEFHQSFVIGRTAKLSDVGFDTVGMLLSRLIIGRKYAKYRSQNS